MWWPGKKQDKPHEAAPTAPSGSSPSPENAKRLAHENLPESLQKAVRNTATEAAFDKAVDGYSAHRYVAYTSDIGESFRPVVSPGIVRAAYGVSWMYLVGDVSFEGYKAYWSNQRTLNPGLKMTPTQQKWTGLPEPAANESTSGSSSTMAAPPGKVAPLDDYRTVMLQRAIFQSVASMGLPAFTIHSVVRYSGQAMKNVKNKTIRTWGPIGLGLSVVPFLPVLFDEPVENAVEWAFHKAFLGVGGSSAVEGAPATGREKLLNKKPKEKEL
ncbi:Mitochondrial fission process protein 1 [Ceratocystis lukuohia]|uniref:Mitochondrial fission process protein 1 n=1 Tax=Ceratocystis lukuohia TaxID=2019550 RepID=A0ABR4MPY0_9PEZI